ncbi:50S ribosomal protein L33 [Patescibacteria group bacterium]|nr:50S ribosomal protein L33 [Patescibacteria group bacterium]MCL5409443.1 50S ribosomal protein L33 [Patescibacteria group bacterium]
MAKKGNRQTIALECSVCKNRNYVTEKNVISTKDKISLNKYCNHCHKSTSHTEVKVK